jgi:DHA2 family multidrug resistance protein-like MFS transporter
MGDGVPLGVSTEASEVAKATLGGALAVAKQLPGQLGAELLNTARDAFVRAFTLTAAISAMIALLMAPVAAVLLRRVGSTPS